MYATLSDIQQRLSDDELIRLTDDQDSGGIDTVIVAAAIETASVEIDSWLGERYTLPLNPVPGIVGHLASDLTIYNLYARNHEGPTEHWQKRYENATAMLARIAHGKISLGVGDPAGGAGGEAIISSSGRIFSRDSMKGF